VCIQYNNIIKRFKYRVTNNIFKLKQNILNRYSLLYYIIKFELEISIKKNEILYFIFFGYGINEKPCFTFLIRTYKIKYFMNYQLKNNLQIFEILMNFVKV